MARPLTETKGISWKPIKEFLGSSYTSPFLYSQMTTSPSHFHETRSVIEKLSYKGSRLWGITPSIGVVSGWNQWGGQEQILFWVCILNNEIISPFPNREEMERIFSRKKTKTKLNGLREKPIWAFSRWKSKLTTSLHLSPHVVPFRCMLFSSSPMYNEWTAKLKVSTW